MASTKTIWLALLAAALAGCNAPQVRRDEETARFRKELQQQTDRMRLDPAVPLSMQRCEELALENSLDLRVREQQLKIQDDRVRLAFVGFLPKFSAAYDYTDRNNNPDIKFNMPSIPGMPAGGSQSFSFQDKRQESFIV